MSEQELPRNLEKILNSKDGNPRVLVENFVKYCNTDSDGIPLPEGDYDFSRRVMQEVRFLFYEAYLNCYEPDAKHISQLSKMGRLQSNQVDRILNASLSDKEIFIDIYSQMSFEKMQELARYLIKSREVAAIPVAFLSGLAMDALFGLEQTCEGPKEYGILKRGYSLYKHGGKIILPSWNATVNEPAIVYLSPHGRIDKVDYSPEDSLYYNNRVKRKNYDGCDLVHFSLIPPLVLKAGHEKSIPNVSGRFDN